MGRALPIDTSAHTSLTFQIFDLVPSSTTTPQAGGAPWLEFRSAQLICDMKRCMSVLVSLLVFQFWTPTDFGQRVSELPNRPAPELELPNWTPIDWA